MPSKQLQFKVIIFSISRKTENYAGIANNDWQ